MGAPAIEDALPRVFLKPETIYCTATPKLVTTLLGSCVAVCLWDRKELAAGMNHYLLPHDFHGRSPRYGDVAIDQLVAKMVGLGCERRNIEAKIFGGADVLLLGTAENNVGIKNIRMAETRLKYHGIPIKAQRTGGRRGLLIRLTTQTGAVLVRMIRPV